MRAEDKKQRYKNILKNISNRRPFGSAKPEEKQLSPHDRALDLINAFDALAELPQAEFNHILCYGPKAVRGPAWSGVVIWYHSKGYHGYQTLNLLGVWAHYRDGELRLNIGTRRLSYRAPVYDPGVYRVAIQNNFSMYYDDDGHPPGEDDRLLYRARFSLNKRLSYRQTLVEILQQWRQEIDAG